jgi:hypothetical protein
MVGTINSTRVDAYPNGWYRVIVTFTTAATPATTNCGAHISASDGTLPASSAAGLDAYVWGIQAEAGAFPTSYIPTTTAAAARSADVCSITGDAFTGFYNPSEGTVMVIVTAAKGYGSLLQYMYGISAASGSDLLAGYRESSKDIRVATLIAGVNQTPSLNGGNLADASSSKIAIASQQGNFAISQNGSINTTSTGLMPSVDRLFIGNRVGSDRAWNGHIAAIRYFKKRLSDAKLQTITV